MKLFQYLKTLIICGPVILYYHFRYMIKFSQHPEKYPLEKRYAIARKEIIFVLNRFHVDYNKKNFEEFTSHNKKALIISNHLGFPDPLILIAQSEKPITFIAKIETFKYPFVRQVAKAIEVFPLDRKNLMNQIGEIRDVVKYLKDESKPSVIVYIEGTRNRNPENPTLDFHPGTLKIAQMAGVPIVVYATFGTFRILNIHSYLKKYPTSLSFIRTINPEDAKQMNTSDLATMLKNEIDTEVDVLRKHDLEFINNLKLSNKKKELETFVDSRVKS